MASIKSIEIVEENNLIEISDSDSSINVQEVVESIEINDATQEFNFEMADVIINNTGNGAVDSKRTLVDFVDPDNVYVGIAEEDIGEFDPYWLIFFVTRSTFSTSIAYADSSEEFDKTWGDRATYTY